MEPTKPIPKFTISQYITAMVDSLSYANVCLDPNYSNYDPVRAETFYKAYLALHEHCNTDILHLIDALNSTIQACQPSNSADPELDLTQ